MNNIPELFGSMVFNDAVMRARLPEDIYKSLHKTISEGGDLDITMANAVAAAMKDWAIEKGATHYTHWFQPMTGITAEKHDSFISPQKDGSVIMEFSGKELIKGEPDASSFPSGGLRATFEARGYTAWDPTSYAFIKDDSLCIPTAFCSYGGEVLDKKTPLLRSMECVSEQATRVCRLLGEADVNWVTTTAGPEQEYFLIDKALFNKRKDLIFTGRTLYGARPPKGQELDDHYFGAIKPRVMEFMKELNTELWKLGIYAKTEHNEAAPSQHELAPVYATVNTATDHNQLTMELMKKVADRHGLACLLHEKPFEGINGSGKHNNWSLQASDGSNIFDSGKHPENNRRFLLFLCAVIEAVDEHQDLMRITVASAGNDHRLGANEAPPAIVSMFLGGEITSILEAIESSTEYGGVASVRMNTGVHVLPEFRKDNADRNRTSPFAFTGNKFEFRMPGSSFSIAGPNIVLNTAVADVLEAFANRIEAASDRDAEITAIMRDTVKNHRRIIFNGNNYAAEWVEEAKRRGLLNLRTTADALPYFVSEKNISLFTRHKIFTESEIRSRCEIMTDSYCKILAIEAGTMVEMARRDIFPAIIKYIKLLSDTSASKVYIGLNDREDATAELAKRLSSIALTLSHQIEALEKCMSQAAGISDVSKKAEFFRDDVLSAMNALRCSADEAETLVASEYWPFPTYGDLLFSV